MYQMPPTALEMSKSTPPVVKYDAMVKGDWSHSAKSGFTAPAPASDAGPVNPMVAYVSSAISGYSATKADAKPEAFHEALRSLLKTPPGVWIRKPSSLLP